MIVERQVENIRINRFQAVYRDNIEELSPEKQVYENIIDYPEKQRLWRCPGLRFLYPPCQTGRAGRLPYHTQDLQQEAMYCNGSADSGQLTRYGDTSKYPNKQHTGRSYTHEHLFRRNQTGIRSVA